MVDHFRLFFIINQPTKISPKKCPLLTKPYLFKYYIIETKSTEFHNSQEFADNYSFDKSVFPRR